MKPRETVHPKVYELISGFNTNMAGAAERLNKLAELFPESRRWIAEDAAKVQEERAGALNSLLVEVAGAEEDEGARLRQIRLENQSRHEDNHESEDNEEEPEDAPSADGRHVAARVSEAKPTFEHRIPGGELGSYYHAVSQFSEAAKQMRAALEVFGGFGRFHGREDNAFQGYQIDLELFRTTVSDMVLDCLRSCEFDRMQLTCRLKREFQEKRLRVEEAQDNG